MEPLIFFQLIPTLKDYCQIPFACSPDSWQTPGKTPERKNWLDCHISSIYNNSKRKKSSFHILSLESEDAFLSISYWIFPYHIGQNRVTFLPLHHDWLKPFRSHPMGLGPACLQHTVKQRKSHVAPWTKQQRIQWDSVEGVGNTKQLWRIVS